MGRWADGLSARQTSGRRQPPTAEEWGNDDPRGAPGGAADLDAFFFAVAPRGVVDAVDGVGHEGGGDVHLHGDLGGVAVGLPGQRRLLLLVDRCEAGAVLHHGQEQPFTLGDRDGSRMTPTTSPLSWVGNAGGVVPRVGAWHPTRGIHRICPTPRGQCALMVPLLSGVIPGGGRRVHPQRQLVSAVLDVVRTGCA